MGERLFSPKSLARVAEAVEWEDELHTYNDGSNNQEQFMKAMSILWERWMRGWVVPDFAHAAMDVVDKRWADAIVRVLRSIPERVSQLRGFYEGLWAGANPGWGRFAWFPNWILPAPMSDSDRVGLAIIAMIKELRVVVAVEEEEGGAEVWPKQV